MHSGTGVFRHPCFRSFTIPCLAQSTFGQKLGPHSSQPSGDMATDSGVKSDGPAVGEGELVADGTVRDILNNQELLDASGLEKRFRLQGCPICGVAVKS